MFVYMSQRFGRDVREGKRRQFNYIGLLLSSSNSFSYLGLGPMIECRKVTIILVHIIGI